MSRHYSQHSSHAWPTRGYAAQHNALGLVFSPADHISHSPRSAAFHSVGEQRATQRLSGSAAGFELSSDSTSDSDMSEEELDPRELRKALDSRSPVSPPPEHWRALIPVEPVYDADGTYVPLINKLPVELLSLIFKLCVEYEVYNLSHAAFHSAFPPLILARVCGLWREIAVDLSVLWQHFELSPCNGKAHPYRMARVFIERTKGKGLHIYYDEAKPRVGESYRPVERCPCSLNIILENLGSVRTLHLRGVEHSTVARISKAHSATASGPLIQYFSLSTLHALLRPDAAQLIARLYCSSALQHLDWDTDTFPCHVPWSQMVSVNLKGCLVAPDVLSDILSTAPRLQKLSHDSLRELAIEGVRAQDSLLRMLHLPHLTELVLHPLIASPLVTKSSDWPVKAPAALHSFIDHLADGLENLDIVDAGAFNESALLHLLSLHKLSNLRRLHFSTRKALSGDRLFQKMLPNQPTGDPALLPRLEILSLANFRMSDGVISGMLHARQLRHYALRVVELGYPTAFHSRLHPIDITAFGELEKHGMIISHSGYLSRS
ncbi:hypothetical protein K525DRAFT_212307 [Schizophyllum commune Loenen D]|nr:hypothetical protein K525DRAFT_212307 [Schizophyllum commune Loenen D]